MVGAVALDEKHRSLVARAGHFLQRGHQHEKPRAFAMLDHAGHVKIVLEYVKCLPNFDLLRSRVNVVHQNIVRVLKLGSFMHHEPAGNCAERIGLDAVDDVEPVYGIELHKHRRDGLHVFQLLQLVANRDRHGSAAERHENGRRRRLHHNVRAHAFGAFGRFQKQSARQPHHDDDQRDLHSHRNDRDDRADGPVQGILQDHVPDQFLGSVFGSADFIGCGSSPTFTSSAPGGWRSTKRSADIVSLNTALVIPICSL